LNLMTLRRKRQQMSENTQPVQDLPKLALIDLYGDGDALRVCEDTPELEKVIAEFEEYEGAAITTGEFYQGFSDFVQDRGVKLYCTRRIVLKCA